MEYLRELREEFEKAADAEQAVWSKNYMKGHFEFLGLNAPARRKVQNKFFKEKGWPEHDEMIEMVLYLWSLSHREFQYLAIDILHKQKKCFRKEDIETIEKLIVTKSWWDTVDGLSAWNCGAYFKMYPENIAPFTRKWMDSGNIWLQRSVLLFQLKYKEGTDVERLSEWIAELAFHEDFFINKAIGWILREYSKTSPEWVKGFVEEHQLSNLSRQEALRFLNKKNSR